VARTPLGKLTGRLSETEKTRLKIEALYGEGLIARRDAERVYEGLFMRSITTLEDFFEELFHLAVLGQSGHPHARVSPRVEFKSRIILNKFVLGANEYVDWLPYKKVEERARVFLRGGRPFTEISDGQRSQVAEWCRVRNAIAHPGDPAKSIFREKVIGERALLRHEKTPAGFLRSPIQPGLNQFAGVLRQMRQFGQDLM
jgi:hypothetical protein